MYFDRADSGRTGRMEINHAGYRLLQSACFQKSEGKLLCTSCHDPHTAAVRQASCGGCHPTAHSGTVEADQKNCASCHMPKRVPVDAVLTTMTDHKIARSPVFSNPREESAEAYTGAAVPYFSEPDDLSYAAANDRASGAAAVSIQRRLVAREPEKAPLRLALAKALLRSGAADEALLHLRKALALEPLLTDARNYLGVAYGALGKYEIALTELRRAVRENPDHTLAWINLGNALEATGKADEARLAYSEAIRLQPDSAEARQRRAALDRR